jgi:hypothetical protein
VLAENMRIGVEIKNIIRDEIWWINLKNVADLMKPIYHLIKFSESSTFRLSDSYVGILRMVYNIMNISEASHFGRAISKDIHNILSIRLDLMLKDDIFMVATFLDHRYNLINWSQSARARILKRLLEYLKGYNASEEELHQTRLQFEKLIPRKDLDKFIDSTSFWKSSKILQNFPNLAIAAVYLDSVVTNSMSCERSFFIFGFLNSPRRNRMSLECLVMSAKLYMHFREKKTILSKKSCDVNLEEVAGADEEIRDEMCMDTLFSDNEDDFLMSATPIQQLLNEMKERTDMAEFHEFINV